MPLHFFDLAAADPAIRFSPYCWRLRFALELKGLPASTTAWRFTDTSALPAGHRTVPTLVDGATVISDSFAIARYLEEAYPDRPSLFGGRVGLAHARLINAWVDSAVQPLMVPLIVRDIWAALLPRDQDYFRTTREARLGTTLEAAQAGRDQSVAAFRKALHPARIALRDAPWLGGAAPSYADCVLIGAFMWARSISHFELLAADDPLQPWLDRMLDLHGGLGRFAPRVPA